MSIPVTVVIPTHNRREHVLRLVSELVRQRCSGDVEIIVCCDRCADGTEIALRNAFGKSVRVLEPPEKGKTAACNAGTLASRPGGLLVFVDDDMEPKSGFIEAHLKAHTRQEAISTVVIGYSQPVIPEKATPLQQRLAHELNLFFEEIGRPGHKNSPFDLTGANFSIRREKLIEAGAFDERIQFQRDDFELAARLLERGFKFLFVPEAHAVTHIDLDSQNVLARMPERARNDLRIVQQHPWCRNHIAFYRAHRHSSWRRRLMWEAAPFLEQLLMRLHGVFPNNLKLLNLLCSATYTNEARRQIGPWKSFDRLVGSTVLPCRKPPPSSGTDEYPKH